MRKGSSSSSSLTSRQERNLREKDRRAHMKHLLGSLLSLLPSFPFRVSSMDALHHAVVYIKQLQERLAQLNARKQELLLLLRGKAEGTSASTSSISRPAEIQISSSDSAVVINLVGGLNTNIQLHQVIRAVQDGGAEVTGASYCYSVDSIFYTIYSQAISPRIGIDISNMMERLKELGF